MVVIKEMSYNHFIKVGKTTLKLSFSKQFNIEDIINYILNNIKEARKDINNNKNILFYKQADDDYRGGLCFWFEFENVDSIIDNNSTLSEVRKEFMRLYNLELEEEK